MREKPLHPAATMSCRSCQKEYQWGDEHSPYCSLACKEVEHSAEALKDDELIDKFMRGYMEYKKRNPDGRNY